MRCEPMTREKDGGLDFMRGARSHICMRRLLVHDG
jgi:hypothetical protein